MIRTRDRVNQTVTYQIREAALTPSTTPAETTDAKHPSGPTWSVALPQKQSDAQYAAFHIAGDPRKDVTENNTAKTGLDIALTPLAQWSVASGWCLVRHSVQWRGASG